MVVPICMFRASCHSMSSTTVLRWVEYLSAKTGPAFFGHCCRGKARSFHHFLKNDTSEANRMICCKQRITEFKRQIVRAAAIAGEGHIASAFSVLDILWILYDEVLHLNPDNPQDPARDRFILSKGHGSLALYAVLAAKGFISGDELRGFAG